MMPVVILTAGGGKRLGRLGEVYKKILVPVGDKSLLLHHFETFSRLGEREFIVVVPPDYEDIRTESRKFGSINIEFVVQEKRKGIGHAAAVAAQIVGDRPFTLVLGDTYYVPGNIIRALGAIKNKQADAILSVRDVKDRKTILNECTIDIDSNGIIRKIIEKPSRPLSMKKPCGIYFFSSGFFRILRRISPSPLRGEMEITDAIDEFIRKGARVVGMETLKDDINITYPEDILKANLLYLKEKGLQKYINPRSFVGKGSVIRKSVVCENCRVPRTARLFRTVLFPKSVVKGGEKITDSLVLPGFAVKLRSGNEK